MKLRKRKTEIGSVNHEKDEIVQRRLPSVKEISNDDLEKNPLSKDI